jgi:hypothetical protein
MSLIWPSLDRRVALDSEAFSKINSCEQFVDMSWMNDRIYLWCRLGISLFSTLGGFVSYLLQDR